MVDMRWAMGLPPITNNLITMHLFLIFLGGGLGAMSRWGLSTGIQSLAEKTSLHRFPFGIFACNILGCFLIGCVFGHFTQKHPAWLFPFLVTGFLGGFTTFSTFGKDTIEAFQDGAPTIAFANILLSVILSLAAVWGGLRIGAA
jgi:CrcB protein